MTYNITIKSKLTPTKTLGPISAKFISEFLHNRKTIFTLNEAAKIYDASKHATGKFLSNLIKRGVLTRIRSGVYLILQTGQENIQTSNWPVIVRNLVTDDNYYISHYSAMRLHGMTTHSLIDTYITIMKRRLPKKINTITYHFIYIKPTHFWGSHTLWITKQDKVNISDVERTILDGLERPDLCGGIKEVIRGIWVKQNEIDWEKMMRYVKKFHSKAVVKRLAFILELLQLNTNYIPLFTKTIIHTKDYILFDPNGPKEGKYIKRWFIRLNVNIKELKASVWE